MIELIALIIFIISFGGILLILVRKMPVLVKLPQNGTMGIKDHRIFVSIEEKIKKVLNIFEKQIILHKILSFAKVIILKAETKIDYLLHKIRKRVKEQKEKDLKK